MNQPRIRPLEERDREPVQDILRRAGNFSAVEIETALELIDEWLEDGEASDYLIYSIEESPPGKKVCGYVCFGPTPLTQGTFDLYWIAVDQASQGKGYGQALLGFAEQETLRRNGRLLLIETSSLETYGATQRFYERAGYSLIARIPEFYRLGDDKLIFSKMLS